MNIDSFGVCTKDLRGHQVNSNLFTVGSYAEFSYPANLYSNPVPMNKSLCLTLPQLLARNAIFSPVPSGWTNTGTLTDYEYTVGNVR